MIVYFYKGIRLVLIIFTSSYFLGIFWYIFINDYETPVLIDPNNAEKGYRPTFKSAFLMKDCGNSKDVCEFTTMELLVKLWYWAITTLSTIGFGDFSP